MKLHKFAALTVSAFFTLSAQAAFISGENLKSVDVQFSSPISVALTLNAEDNLIAGGYHIEVSTLLATGNVTVTNPNGPPATGSSAAVKLNHTPFTGNISAGNIIAAYIDGQEAGMNQFAIALKGSNWSSEVVDSENWAFSTQNNADFEIHLLNDGSTSPSPGTYILSMTASSYSA
jgi:hypothetical protein